MDKVKTMTAEEAFVFFHVALEWLKAAGMENDQTFLVAVFNAGDSTLNKDEAFDYLINHAAGGKPEDAYRNHVADYCIGLIRYVESLNDNHRYLIGIVGPDEVIIAQQAKPLDVYDA
jgi:hypothetical protein